jgi:hypothetical protein
MRELDESVKDNVCASAPWTPTRLDPRDQRALATWAVKTSLAFCTKESPEMQDELGVLDLSRAFGASRQPPAGAHVWLGQRVEADGASFRAFSASAIDNMHEPVSALGAALSIRHSVFFLLILTAPAAAPIGLRGEAAGAFARIFPASNRPLVFPREFGIASRDLAMLIEDVLGNPL